MSNTIQCPSCKKRFLVREEFRGKKARCKCGQTISIPAVEDAVLGSSWIDEDLSADLGAASSGQFLAQATYFPAPAKQPQKRTPAQNHKRMMTLAYVGGGGLVVLLVLVVLAAGIVILPRMFAVAQRRPTHWTFVNGRDAVKIEVHLSSGETLRVKHPQLGVKSVTTEIQPDGLSHKDTIHVAIGPRPTFLEARDAIRAALVKIGPSCLPQLRSAIESHPNSDVRWNAVLVVQEFGPQTEGVVSTVTSALRDENANVRFTAAKALAAFGSEARDSVGALVELINQKPRDGASTVAVQILGELNVATPESVAALARLAEDGTLGEAGVNTLSKFGSDVEGVVPTLIAAAKKSNGAAIAALGQMGPKADEAVPLLVELAVTRRGAYRRGEREEAADALVRIGRVTPELVAALDDDSDGLIRKTLEQLGAAASLELLTRLSRLPKTAYVRNDVAEHILRKLGSTAIPSLVSATENRDPGIRKEGLLMLAQINAASPESQRAFATAIRDENRDARIAALIGLARGGMEARELIPSVGAIMANRDLDLKERGAAINAFASIGQKEDSVVPAIIATLFDNKNDIKLRFEAASVLERIGESDSRVIPALITGLANPDARIRNRVVYALRDIGPPAKAAVPALQELRSKEPKLATAVRAALEAIQSGE